MAPGQGFVASYYAANEDWLCTGQAGYTFSFSTLGSLAQTVKTSDYTYNPATDSIVEFNITSGATMHFPDLGFNTNGGPVWVMNSSGSTAAVTLSFPFSRGGNCPATLAAGKGVAVIHNAAMNNDGWDCIAESREAVCVRSLSLSCF